MTPGNKASQRDTVLAGQTVCGACGCHPARSCRPRSRCACTPTSSATNSPKAAFHDRKGVGKSSRTVCHQSWAGRYSTAAHKRQVPCSGLAAVVARLAAKRRGIMGGVSELIVVSGPPGAGKRQRQEPSRSSSSLAPWSPETSSSPSSSWAGSGQAWEQSYPWIRGRRNDARPASPRSVGVLVIQAG
jgi:hypothetical protein